MINHYKSAHSENTNIFICSTCGTFCKEDLELSEHEKSHKSKIKGTSQVELSELFESELAIDMRDSKCNLELDDVDKNEDGTVTAECADRMESWRSVHFRCGVCSVDLTTHDLKKHFAVHHRNVKEKSFECKLCATGKPSHSMNTAINHHTKIHDVNLSYR